MISPMSGSKLGQPIKRTILLIDGEPLSRDCLAEALGRAFSSAAIVAVSQVDQVAKHDGSERILAVIKSMAGDALATDVRRLAETCPGVPVVVIASCDQQSTAAAIEAGAHGLLPVTTPLRVGIAVLQLVAAGGTYFPTGDHVYQTTRGVGGGARPPRGADSPTRTALAPVMPQPAEASAAPLPAPNGGMPVQFTAREAEVLAVLQRGRSNKWIAGQLNLSENTVKVHIRHIMRKLRATNRTQAVVLSTRHMAAQSMSS